MDENGSFVCILTKSMDSKTHCTYNTKPTYARIELDAESFGVTRSPRAHLLVRGVFLVPVDVADLCLQDARNALVRQLNTPKATFSTERAAGGCASESGRKSE